jgi:hypothetical protein
MAIVIKTDGTKDALQPKNNKIFTLEELKSVVGGYIEIVPLTEDYLMVINEEGKLLNLPINVIATRVYRASRNTDDFIVGNVLICSNKEIE